MKWVEKRTLSGLKYATAHLSDSKYLLVIRQWYGAVLDSGLVIRDTVDVFRNSDLPATGYRSKPIMSHMQENASKEGLEREAARLWKRVHANTTPKRRGKVHS